MFLGFKFSILPRQWNCHGDSAFSPSMFGITQEEQKHFSLSKPENFEAGEEGLETIRALKFSFLPTGSTSDSAGIQCFWQWKTSTNPKQKSSRALHNWLGFHPALLLLREERFQLGETPLLLPLHCQGPCWTPGHLSPTLIEQPHSFTLQEVNLLVNPQCWW